MARGRMLNTTVADDVRLNSLSLESHFLFMMTIPHLDRDGLIKADGMVFAGRVFPRRPELLPKMDALIEEWIDCSLVIAYQTDSHGRVLCFPNFAKNQIGLRYNREPASELPPPPGYIRSGEGLQRVDSVPPTSTPPSGGTPDTPQQPSDGVQTDSRKLSGNVPANGRPNIREENIREGERKAPTADSYLPMQEHTKHVATMTALNALLPAKERVLYVDPIAGYMGVKSLIDSGDDKWLIKVHNLAVWAHSMGITVDDFRSWWSKWKKDFRSEGATEDQFKRFCGQRMDERNQLDQAKSTAPTSEVTDDLMAFLEAQAHERFVAERNGAH